MSLSLAEHFRMSDDDHDYTIENADAGASLEIPTEAGTVS